jgi:pyrroline-5-carboxylate reductase
MVERNFYFVGFGNMARAIYQKMDKKAYGSIGIIETEEKCKELDTIIETENGRIRGEDSSKDFYITTETIICNLAWWEFNWGDVTGSDIFLFAVKPADMKMACEMCSNNFDWDDPDDSQNQPLIISIAAGVTTNSIAKSLGENFNKAKIVRAMPNLCAKKGMAITGLYGDSDYFENGDTSEGMLISKIFTSIGQALWVGKESDLDSVTAISGSGPAYIYYIMNAMIDAAKELGLEKSVAQKLVAQTIIGAGETGKDIDHLESEIVKVSSKGGTTEKAIDVFKQKKLDTIIKQAVKAAHKRSKELSK